MAYNYQCTFNLQSCISTLGLDDKGRVQQYVTNEVLSQSTPYVPFDVASKYENPGRLMQSGHIENETDVVWDTPYARRLYYHPEYNYQGAPVRGGYWVDRMMQNGGKELIEAGARKVAGQ